MMEIIVNKKSQHVSWLWICFLVILLMLEISGCGGGSSSTGSSQDTTPDAFSFNSRTGVAVNTPVESDPVTIRGINAPSSISITGADGKYSINGGEYRDSAGTVNNGDSIKVRVTSLTNYNAPVSTTLNVGGVSAVFNVTTESADQAMDTTPDPFTFTAMTGVLLNIQATAAAITVSGINSPASISIAGGGGMYSINNAAYTNTNGIVKNGDKVSVRLTSAATENTSVSTTLTIGGVAGSFVVTTGDMTPDTFSFTAQTGVVTNTATTSNTITVSGISRPSPITISGATGTYSRNGGTFISTAGYVISGDSIRVKLTSSTLVNTTTSVTLTIGGVSSTFNVTTATGVGDNPDTTPDPFSFPLKTDVDLNSTITSDSITVSGIDAPTAISVTGGTYSINDGVYTSAGGTVSAGNTVRIQLTSSSVNSTTTSATLTIGGVSNVFNVTTKSAGPLPQDTIPDPFAFTQQTNMNLNVACISNEITVSGIDAAAPISITGGMYSINSGSYSTAGGTVHAGNIVKIRLTSSSSNATTVIATLTIGGVSGTFAVTTKAAVPVDDPTPDPFVFTAQTGIAKTLVNISNYITVTGINVQTPISIAGEDGKYSINGGNYTNSPGTVQNGDIISVQVTLPVDEIATSTILVIGGVSGAFNVASGMEWVSISGHSVAISKEGFLYAWGYNESGRIGDGSNISKSIPTKIGSDADWLSVSEGGSHTVAIKKDGSLYVWGRNDKNQLGLGAGNVYWKLTPTRIGNENDWYSVSAGSGFTIAIKKDGSLYAWGNNDYGQLGDGTTESRNTPKRIGTDYDWRSVSAGYAFTLAVKKDGSLYAWGNNTGRQLGDGTTENKNTPTRIGNDDDWSIISAGQQFSTAIKKDGTLYSWGNNNYGQLGNGTNNSISQPTKIGIDNNWLHVSAGSLNAAALKKDGTLFTWGANFYGQLGNNTQNPSLNPTRIGNASDWVLVSTSSDTTIAVKRDGSLYSWGYNAWGGTGDGSQIEFYEPYKVGSNNDYMSIAAGDSNVAAVKKDGSLWAWGNCQLGYPGLLNTPTSTGTDKDWLIVSSGRTHRLALKTDGSLYGWGFNQYGELGNLTYQTSPKRIGSENDWLTVSAGYDYSVAIKKDGSLYTWGKNDKGQLGDGTTTNRNIPTRIGSDNDWLLVSSSINQTFAIKKDGSLYGWGSGPMGNGATEVVLTPTRIGTDNDWSSISAGAYHIVAIKKDGSLFAWGSNDYGQLGDGTYVAKAIPTRIGIDTDWLSVSVGERFSVALKMDGSLYSWGVNNYGKLGDGTLNSKQIPTRIGTDNDWVSACVGPTHAVAIKQDGSLYTWGWNLLGQIGDGFTWRLSPVKIELYVSLYGQPDKTPAPFSFSSQTNSAVGSIVTSNPITVSGLAASTVISIAGGNGSYSVNGGAYTQLPGFVQNGDMVTVRMTTPGTSGASVSTTLNIGGVLADFTVTTAAPPNYDVSDLYGNWYFIGFASGAGTPLWSRGLMSVATSGDYNATLLAHNGYPMNFSGTLTAIPGGILGDSTSGTFRASMDRDKTVIAGTDNKTTYDSFSRLYIITKKAPSYAVSDLAGAWRMVGISTGVDEPSWDRGLLTVDGSGAYTYTGSDHYASGGFLISADGVVTENNGSNYTYGMDAGKTVMGGTGSRSGSEDFLVVLKQAESYGQADLVGEWEASIMATEPGAPFWARGAITITADGTYNGTLAQCLNGAVNSVVCAGVLAMGSDGVIVRTDQVDNHVGYMDAGKTVMAFVGNWRSGQTTTAEMMILTRMKR